LNLKVCSATRWNGNQKPVRQLLRKHQGGEVEEFTAARAAVLLAERNLAAAKGEQYAVPIEFPVSLGYGRPTTTPASKRSPNNLNVLLA
jgi:hypothetical protein